MMYPVEKKPLKQLKSNSAYELVLGLGLLVPNFMDPDHVVTEQCGYLFLAFFFEIHMDYLQILAQHYPAESDNLVSGESPNSRL